MGEQGARILLVEDELYLRDLYTRVLSSAGFHVTSAVDGLEGLEMAQSMPDLILLDIMMPRLNGIELLKRLKRDVKTKNLSIVLLTNLGQEYIIKDALNSGARGYIMKVQISPYELIDKIKKFLEDPDFKTEIETVNVD